MTFKTLETLLKINTQDSQSKVPTNFPQWKMVIESGIKKLEDETEEEIRTADLLEDEASNIPLVEDIAIALVYHLSQMFSNDIVLKQKYIVDYEDAKGTFLWNKFKERELTI